MSDTPPKVVYDCNVFVQSMINKSGPAGRCLQKARGREVELFVSPYVLVEIRESYGKVPPRFGLTYERAQEFSESLGRYAVVIDDVPHRYDHPIDPDDSHYIDLAIRASANLVVSRDRHLLMLMDLARREGREFRSLFPALRILDPVEFLRELAPDPTSEQV